MMTLLHWIRHDFFHIVTTSQKISELTVSEGDLLMTIVGTIGRVAIVPAGLNGICLQRSVAVIKPNKEIINNRYLMYQLQNMRSVFRKRSSWCSTERNLSQTGQSTRYKAPGCLNEQKQIVKVLDKVDRVDFPPQTATYQTGRAGKGTICGDVWNISGKSI